MVVRKAGSNSRRQYERGADRMIAASASEAEFDWHAALPGEKVDALLAYLGKDVTLCAGTVTHYTQCARSAIERILADAGEDDVAAKAIAGPRNPGAPDRASGSPTRRFTQI